MIRSQTRKLTLKQRRKPHDKLKLDLENTSTGVAYTLEAMHSYLTGGADSRIRKFITPLHQKLCSDKPEDAYKHIGWYLRTVNAYLEMQFSYQLCAVALRLLILRKSTILRSSTAAILNVNIIIQPARPKRPFFRKPWTNVSKRNGTLPGTRCQ